MLLQSSKLLSNPDFRTLIILTVFLKVSLAVRLANIEKQHCIHPDRMGLPRLQSVLVILWLWDIQSKGDGMALRPLQSLENGRPAD